LDDLHGHLDAAVAGHGNVVFVAGEAGSGKTMLAKEFMRQAMRFPELLVAAGTCNAFGGFGDPYLPFRELLSLLCGNVESGYTAGALDREQATRLWEAIPSSARLVSELAPSLLEVMVNGALLVDRAEQALPGAEWIAALRDRVVAVAGRPAAQERLQPGLFEDYTAVLERLSIIRPLLLVVDDLQWADRGSLALLWHLARRLEGMRVLLLGAYRPEEIVGGPADGPALLDVMRDLQARSPDCVIELRNDREFVDEYLDSEPNALDAPFRERLFAYTGGNPLFTVELVRGMQDRAELRRDRVGVWRARGSLDWDRLPSRVEAVVAQRIARLPEPLRSDLAVASVQGQDFIVEVVGDVRSDRGAPVRLSRESSAPHRLIDPSGVDRVGGVLVGRQRFRHVLFQRYLYDRLDPAERIRLHEATGRSLENLYRDQPDAPVVELARHFEEAGLPEPAIEYLHRAGQRAIRMAASEEAIGVLERALALVRSLPESSERDEWELAVLASLAAPVMAVRGYAAPEAEQIGSRVLALRERVPPSPTMVLALTGMATVLSLRGRYSAAAEVSKEALRAGATMDDPPGLTLKARQVLGYDQTWMGQLADGHATLELAHRDFDPVIHAWVTDATGSAPGPDALVWDAINTLHRGYPARAMELAERGIAMARSLGHAFTLCHALAVGGSVLRAMTGDFTAALPFIDEFEAIAAAEHFPFYSVAATIHRGQVRGHLGDPEAAIDDITAGLDAWRSIGIEAFRGPFLGDVAEFHRRMGRPERGLEVVEGALEDARAQTERLTEVTLLVQQGLLLGEAWELEAARAVLEEARTTARETGMLLLELRAATGLARWARGADERAFRSALADVYSRFDEGLDTPYLGAAYAVLAASADHAARRSHGAHVPTVWEDRTRN
jgi:tetratricopeptide (TPR) repeat protein